MARHDNKVVKSVYDPMAKNNIVPIEQSEFSSKEIERLRKLPKTSMAQDHESESDIGTSNYGRYHRLGNSSLLSTRSCP